MEDNVLPIINLKNPLVNDGRVLKDTVTVQIACRDDNGIALVTYKRGNSATTAISSVDSLYSVKITGLTTGKSDTITFVATDKSTKANSQKLEVIVHYNSIIGAVTLGSPKADSTGVPVQPSFTWTGGTDPDGDAVYFRVRYGTTPSGLTTETSEVTASPATITASNALTPYTKYYWQVKAYSKVNNDSSLSEVRSFTTIGIAPQIITSPRDTTLSEGGTLKLTVIATGTPAPTYKWFEGTNLIPSATSATYSKTNVTNADAGSYYVIVSNGVSPEAKSTVSNVVVTKTYTITFDDQNATIPVTPKTKTVITPLTSHIDVLPTEPQKSNYTFAGWWTAANGGTQFLTSTTVSANDTVFAKWNPVYTVTFDGQGATTPANPNTIKVIAPATTVGTLPADPVKRSYVFSGWYTAKAGKGSRFTASTQVTTTMTVYAFWQIKDVDDNVYTEVTIGNQVWMAQNLKTTRFNDKSAIWLEESDVGWRELTTPGYCWLTNNIIPNKETYGALYNGYAAATSNLAPEGWHVATSKDWTDLETYLGSDVAGGKLKDTTWFSDQGYGTTNETGFSALPGGQRYDGTFHPSNVLGLFWTSTENVADSSNAWVFYLRSQESKLFTDTAMKREGFSVRCIRD